MSDPFQHERVSREMPARNAAAVTPHDANDLAVVTRALWVGGDGDLSVILAGDDDPVTIKGASQVVPIAVRRVRATGTTATDIVALW